MFSKNLLLKPMYTRLHLIYRIGNKFFSRDVCNEVHIPNLRVKNWKLHSNASSFSRDAQAIASTIDHIANTVPMSTHKCHTFSNSNRKWMRIQIRKYGITTIFPSTNRSPIFDEYDFPTDFTFDLRMNCGQKIN